MKIIKFLQVNIYKGRYLAELINFIRREAPDFITMQEVTRAGFNLWEDKAADTFEVIREKIKMDGVYNGDLKLTGEEGSDFGNAVFSKYKIIGKDVVVLKSFRPVTLEELDGASAFEIRPQIPRHLLDVQVEYNNVVLHILSWHGAWTAPPVDTSETLRQAKVVADYLESIDGPFILGGDLNNIPGSKTIGLIDNAANNLMSGSGILETTNPKVHKIAPKGFLIDYVFTSKEIKLINIKAPQVTISDHLPVVAEMQF